MSGWEPGASQRKEAGAANGPVDRRLRELAQMLARFGQKPENGKATVDGKAESEKASE